MQHTGRAFFTALFVTIGLSAPMQAETGTVDVTVSYLERIALPPDAELSVSLLDTSLMDVSAVQLSQQRFKLDRVPFQVLLPYDPALIDDRHTYTVAAEIMSKRRVVFRTTAAYPVLTRGAPDQVDLVLQKMPATVDTAAPGGGVVGLAWQVFEIDGTALDADDPPTMTIDADGNLGLYGGCNRFRGQVTLNDGQLSFPNAMAGTRMACPPERMALEQRTLKALEASTSYARDGDNLVFRDEAGKSALRFRQQRG